MNQIGSWLSHLFLTPNDKGICNEKKWFESKDNGMIAIQHRIKKQIRKQEWCWCVILQSLFYLGNINNDPNVDELCWLCENSDFKSDQCFNCTNETKDLNVVLEQLNSCMSSSRYKFFGWDKLVNLMRSECHCDSNGHALVIASGSSQLAKELMIRDADPNVLNVKENQRIMYYAIEQNNL